MSRTILNAELYLCGSPNDVQPARAWIRYQLRDDADWSMRKHEVWVVQNPDWTKPFRDFLEQEIVKIEEEEGLVTSERHKRVIAAMSRQQGKVG